MAWGTTGITEHELERIAAVREYFYETVPAAVIRDTYDPARLAQIFEIDTPDTNAVYTAVVSTEFLDQHSPEQIGEKLIGWSVSERLRTSERREVIVTSLGLD